MVPGPVGQAWHDRAVTPTAQSEDQPNKGRRLLSNMVFGAVMFALLGTVTALIESASVAGPALGGAVSGLVIGAGWFWQARRAVAYRAKVDPTRRNIAPSDLTVTDAAAAERVNARRYRHRRSLALAIVSCALFLPVAVLATAAPDASALVTLGFWAMVALAGSFLTAMCLTYTEVDRHGLRVRTLTTRHTIPWHDLAEVRWVRESDADRLVFRTKDGREIKSVGLAVTDIGLGRRAADQAVDDIEQTWGRHL